MLALGTQLMHTLLPSIIAKISGERIPKTELKGVLGNIQEWSM
jgi:hypothetical protein